MGLTIFLLISLMFLSKNSKPLLVLISMEAATSCVVTLMLLSSFSLNSMVMIMVLTFFVSESLIILTSLYKASRDWGNISSTLLF